MTETEIRIVKRLVTYMQDISEQQIDFNFFMGVGLTLAICYEEMTGRTAQNKKPRELMQWALDLPLVTFPHVGSN
jgi:hypothetical protein